MKFTRIKYNCFACFWVLLLVLIGCREKPSSKDYVARVGDYYLLKKDIDKEMVKKVNQGKYRSDFIRDWVEKKVLFEEAKNQGILADSIYQSSIQKIKVDLASALLLKNVMGNKIAIDSSKIINYYNLNKNEFKTVDNAVIINFVKFSNKNSAINFRNYLIKNNWQSSLERFKNDSTVIDYKLNQYYNNYELSPKIFFRYLENLDPGEIGIVIKIHPDVFVVAQINSFIRKGELPQFSVVSKIVEQRFLISEKKKQLRKYISNLYSKYRVDIKKEIK